MNKVCIIEPYLPKTHSNNVFPIMTSASSLQAVQLLFSVFFISPIHVTRLTHLILHDLIIIMLFGVLTVLIIKFLIMHFSLASRHFIPRTSTYSIH